MESKVLSVEVDIYRLIDSVKPYNNPISFIIINPKVLRYHPTFGLVQAMLSSLCFVAELVNIC